VAALKKINVMESVYKRNEKYAAEFNARLTDKRVYCVNVMGSPGAGKTTLLLDLAKRLAKPVFVIEGDVASDIDARTFAAAGVQAAQINTGSACHLNAADVVRKFDETAAGFTDGFLFIENIGNLICPADFLLGEHVRVLVCAVTDGGDKPYKYPMAFEKAGAVLLNKTDLLKYVNFNIDFFTAGLRRINATAPLFRVSGATGEGLDAVAEWLTHVAGPVFA